MRRKRKGARMIRGKRKMDEKRVRNDRGTDRLIFRCIAMMS